ncbi:hypothetical protein [Streptomyces sp. G1]|uniref:hypothetical protein n=1 Tax=Streptomyces sp. G1 TaxID=361572 RepID=UPI00202F456E|nr:hypothetical protein [Streptomyces sp. G1]MCM1968001.1 hypothetical protein [Streptomyces sp. G1]
MRTTPATHAEADAWITVLMNHGYLHRVDQGPENTWTVWRASTSTPHTLHDPALAIDYVTRILREIRPHASEARR